MDITIGESDYEIFAEQCNRSDILIQLLGIDYFIFLNNFQVAPPVNIEFRISKTVTLF